MLTTADKRALTVFKWRYLLESQGFTREQAARLVFWKWLAANGRCS
jgi:hypothetical protein